MTTITSVASGNWGTAGTWDSGIPQNGDNVIIAEGHEVLFNVDQSGFSNGLASLVINGILHFKNTSNTCLKMNGNVTGTGRLYVASIWEMTAAEIAEWYTPEEGYPNVYKDWGGFMAVETLDGESFTEVNSIEEVNETPNSIYLVWEDYILCAYWNPTDDANRYFTAINRPGSGNEYRCYILFNPTGIINIPNIKKYGWYPERESTTLASDAPAGQADIVLTHDMGFQEGDIIGVGSGEEYGPMAESNKGAYTIASYNSETKTVTLTANLGANRLAGDLVVNMARPIKIARTSSPTTAIFVPGLTDVIMRGVKNSVRLVPATLPATLVNIGWDIQHCSCDSNGTYIAYALANSIIKYCTSVNTPYALIMNSYGIEVNDLATISGSCIYTNGECVARNIFEQNINYPSSGSFIDGLVSKNLTYIYALGYRRIKNGVIDAKAGSSNASHTYYPLILIDSEITLNDAISTYGTTLKCYNCIINGEEYIPVTDDIARAVNVVFESFDHNQIPGNYKAWCKGGTIETDFDGETCLPGRLIFNCESADDPVFLDYNVLLPAYRTMRWQALANKSFTGGEVKIELIDPTNDPLIDPTAAPLASYSLPDQTETNLPLKLGYKSDVAMQAILRISAQNSEGTVEVDTRLIENRIQHGS